VGVWRLSLAVIARMVGWSLLIDIILGLLYGPLSVLILQVIYTFYRLIKGGSNNESLPAILSTTDPGALVVVIIASIILGLVYGVLIGSLSGIATGMILSIALRRAEWSLIGEQRHRSIQNGISACVSGLLTLILLVLLDLPAALDYLGAGWILLGWVMYIALPVLLVFGAAWWISNQVITWYRVRESGL
jgi:hypothetical protein